MEQVCLWPPPPRGDTRGGGEVGVCFLVMAGISVVTSQLEEAEPDRR